MSSKRPSKFKLIKPRGMGLSVHLFRHSGLQTTPTKLASLLRGISYSSKKKKGLASGFTSVKASGDIVIGEFVSGFRVPVLAYKDGELTSVHYVSIDRGTVLVKLDRETIEVRGSRRIANKFSRLLEDTTGAKVTPLSLNGGAKKLYDRAMDVASVLVTDVEKGNLRQAEFRGSGIQSEEEIGLYTRRYKGHISRFRGTFSYPSGAILTTSVNAESGSLMIYQVGDGILQRDLDWIIDLMEAAAP
ncbi:MAG: hypothetical protein E3J82_05155 [Candidatus Thorarchaeota archaeon]|nr:MAG: hypothetical protein E3J82_05155 [Candidatus Thorarchaeota archaeon]